MDKPASVVARCSTDVVAPPERLAYWVDAISDALFAFSTSSERRTDFNAGFAMTPLDGLVIVAAHSSEQTSMRSKRMLARSSDHAYHLMGDLRHSWVFIRDGERLAMQAGDLVLTDTREPFGAAFVDDCAVANIRLPPLWLHTWMRNPDAAVGLRIDSTGAGRSLSALVARLTPDVVAATALPHRVLSEQVGALLALVEIDDGGASFERPGRDVARRQNTRRILDVVKQRANEPDLDATAVAAVLGVDGATLHRWLAASGMTFGAMLQKRRARVARDKQQTAAARKAHGRR